MQSPHARGGAKAGGAPRLAIVGAGPAGSMAALAAAGSAEVHLFDTNETVGRKLLVTGNGRCNLSNLNARAERYLCAERTFVETALSLCGPRQTLARLRELGILTYATDDGWCYPLSDSAATVVQALDVALRLAGVSVQNKTKVSDLTRVGDHWRLTLGGGPHALDFDRVIVATGGKAYPALGSRGELFPILERLGHCVAPVHPALVPLTGDMRPWHKLQGVRLDVSLRLMAGEPGRGELLAQSVGNLLFTATGLSGPAAMDVSYVVSERASQRLYAELDLLPHRRAELDALVAAQRRSPLPLAVALGALLGLKLPLALLELAGLAPGMTLAQASDDALARLLEFTRRLTVRITGTRGFEAAQLSTGGVAVREVEPATMASRLLPGLAFAGEVLDVQGPCGGYNLQWAWTSGALAGAAAVQRG